MEPYLVIVLLNPTEKQKEEGGVTSIVVQPSAVMAKDEKHATIRAMRLVPEEFVNMDDRLEVRVIPFRRG
jgi:hypothetical protein